MFCLELGCMIHFDSHALQADRVESSATTVVNNGGMLFRYLLRSVDGVQFYKPFVLLLIRQDSLARAPQVVCGPDSRREHRSTGATGS